jgi:5-formaminoimidazole-4-carboxamide-1-beta-D-ribofuranosyl 5'-monophosphate synthetase
VLSEECHGEIGYFLDRDKAYEAARDVIMINPYDEHWDELTHNYIQTEVTRDQITDEQIDDYVFGVSVYVYKLNSAWCH